MSQSDSIKEAFGKAKQDIQELKDNFNIIINEIQGIKRTLEYIQVKNDLNQIANYDTPTDKQTEEEQKPTEIQHIQDVEEIPTEDWPYKRLKPHIYSISTGNNGVPTDKQTNQQTDTLTRVLNNSSKIDQIERVSEILRSLNSIKKDLRSKFKRLTKQEMLVFSTLYQLQEENIIVDYSQIALKIGLSESSIRDYIQKITKKGIPIEKLKENNKKIILKISDEFKKIASLQTILQLREL